MKTRNVLPFLAILVLAGVASAQPRMPSPEDQAKRLKEQLKLSDDQTVEVTKVLKETREKSVKLREKGEPGPGMREAFMKLVEEGDKKIMKILDADQQKQYTKLMEERRQNMRNRRRPR